MKRSGGPYPESDALHMWEHAGLQCAIVSSGIGFVNGYVRVPETHVAYDKSYNRVTVSVHGGLTYGNGRGWFGFDTGHGGDGWSAKALIGIGLAADVKHAESLAEFGPIRNDWNRELLIAETESLADQLAVMTELPDPDQWNVTEEEFAQLLADQKALRAIRDVTP